MAKVTKSYLQTKTKAELADMAQVELGFRLDKTLSKDQMIEAILRSHSGAEKVEPVDNEDNTRPGKGKVRIIIERDHRPGFQQPVWYGHQGKSFLVPRGVPIDIKANTMSALIDAKEYQMIWDQNIEVPGGRGAMIRREVRAYPFQVVA